MNTKNTESRDIKNKNIKNDMVKHKHKDRYHGFNEYKKPMKKQKMIQNHKVLFYKPVEFNFGGLGMIKHNNMKKAVEEKGNRVEELEAKEFPTYAEELDDVSLYESQFPPIELDYID